MEEGSLDDQHQSSGHQPIETFSGGGSKDVENPENLGGPTLTTNSDNLETRDQKRWGSWGAFIFSLVMLAFFCLSAWIGLVKQNGVLDIADKILMPTTFLMFILCLVSFFLIRRDRHHSGSWILFLAVAFPPPLAALLWKDFGQVSVLYVLAVLPIIIFRVLSKPSRSRAIIFAIGLGLAVVAFDIWDPEFQENASVVPNFSYGIIAIMLLGLLVFSWRRAMRGSLREKLIASYLLIVTIPLGIVGLIVSINSYYIQAHLGVDAQFQVAQRVAGKIENFVRSSEMQLLTLIEVTGIGDLGLDEQTVLLNRLISHQDLYQELILLNNKGQELIRLSQNRVFSPEKLANRADALEFRIPFENEETYFGPIMSDLTLGKHLMSIAIPIIDLELGEISHILIATLRLEKIREFMANEERVLFLIDKSSKVILQEGAADADLTGQVVNVPEENDVTQGVRGTIVVMARDRIQLNQQEIDLVVEQSSSVALKLVNSNIYITVASVIVMIGLSILFGSFASRVVTVPMGELADAAKAVTTGDLQREIAINSDDEIGILAATFSSMTSKLCTLIGSLEQKVEDRTHALKTSTEVSRRISTILDQDQLVQEVVEQVQQALNYYHAHIYLFDESHEKLLMVGGTGEVGQTLLENGHKISRGMGLVGRVGEYNQAILVSDVAEEPDWLPNRLLPDTKAEVAVPIAVGEKVIGVMDIQNNEAGSLSQADVDLLLSITSQVAVAIQNARAYRAAQHQAQREALIAEINQHIQSTKSIDEALQVAVRDVGRALGAETMVRLQGTEFGNNDKKPRIGD